MSNIKKADFIVSAEDYGDICPSFSKSISVTKKVKKAVAEISALGVYEAFFNGERLGNFIMAPGWTAHQARQQYQTYDITALVKEDNFIEINVGSGWLIDNLSEQFHDVPWKQTIKRPCTVAAITVEYEDGTSDVLLTDKSWKASKSEILLSKIYDGETFDARLQGKREWGDTDIFEYSRDVLIEQEGEDVIEHEVFEAQKLFTAPNGETIVDFGQEITGYVEFIPQGESGDVIEIDHGETLDKDGNFYNANYRSAKALITYICDGTNKPYKAHHTFYGFRYIRIKKWSGELKKEFFKAIAVYSNIKRTGHFECSDKMINQLYSNVIWSNKDNFLDVPTDCPQRDERLGWTGDANVFCKTAAYNFDVERFFNKWLRDVKADQRPNGGIPDIVPSVFGYADSFESSSFWGDAAVVIPWEMYLAYGNKAALEEHFDCMKKYVESMRKAGSCEYLYDTKNHFSDWLALDGVYNRDEDGTSLAYKKILGTAAYAHSTDILIKAGKVLGYDMTEYEELYKGIIKAYNDNYVVDGDLIYKTQTMYVLAVHFNLIEDKALYAKRLVDLIKANGNRLNTGFVGTAYLMDALTESGYTDVAYTLLLQKEFPSWLFSVRMGATTIWEHWDSINEKGEMWSTEMNSFNHYAYGAVAAWMYGVMAGINYDEINPGYKSVIIKPVPDDRIDWVKASLETRCGLVESQWKHEDGKVVYNITVPEGVTAKITIGDKTEIVTGGIHTYTK